ncbi:MAG TPA: superoxide dismutase [Allosphingosinicella sp.]|nr:superoxide dismutase [Allosphingosinicella sp.]
MTFKLPDLPFAKDALGQFMSAETLDFHHGKHHQAYVDKTNQLAGGQGWEGRALTEVIRAAKEKGDKGLFNNGAQFWNHNFFWQCLAPPEGQRPSGKLAAMIEEGFGTADDLLAKLKEEAVGHFGSGWAWLVLDRDALRITSLHDADTPVVHDGMKPLLTLDVWEHAYYLDYRNERPKFAESVLGNIVNWEFVGQNLDGDGVARADQGARALAEA